MTNTIITAQLKERCGSLCELCNTGAANLAYPVSPRNNDAIENEVALCDVCIDAINNGTTGLHWQCLAGSIWSQEQSVQALSYRILYGLKEQDWASEIIHSVELDEPIVNWAMSAYETTEKHKDSNGTVLQNGDTVVLTQGLNVKGANFLAPKGTIIRKIRLVPDDIEQIEGKINQQTIIILTKYVRKS